LWAADLIEHAKPGNPQGAALHSLNECSISAFICVYLWFQKVLIPFANKGKPPFNGRFKNHVSRRDAENAEEKILKYYNTKIFLAIFAPWQREDGFFGCLLPCLCVIAKCSNDHTTYGDRHPE